MLRFCDVTPMPSWLGSRLEYAFITYRAPNGAWGSLPEFQRDGGYTTKRWVTVSTLELNGGFCDLSLGLFIRRRKMPEMKTVRGLDFF